MKNLEFGLLNKGVSKTTENRTKEQNDRFFGVLLGTLAANFMKNLLAGKIERSRRGVLRAGEETIKAVQLDRLIL